MIILIMILIVIDVLVHTQPEIIYEEKILLKNETANYGKVSLKHDNTIYFIINYKGGYKVCAYDILTKETRVLESSPYKISGLTYDDQLYYL